MSRNGLVEYSTTKNGKKWNRTKFVGRMEMKKWDNHCGTEGVLHVPCTSYKCEICQWHGILLKNSLFRITLAWLFLVNIFWSCKLCSWKGPEHKAWGLLMATRWIVGLWMSLRCWSDRWELDEWYQIRDALLLSSVPVDNWIGRRKLDFSNCFERSFFAETRVLKVTNTSSKFWLCKLLLFVLWNKYVRAWKQSNIFNIVFQYSY